MSGAFFYDGNTALARHMETALTANGLGGHGEFLERFKAYGWYLDEWCLSIICLRRSGMPNVSPQ